MGVAPRHDVGGQLASQLRRAPRALRLGRTFGDVALKFTRTDEGPPAILLRDDQTCVDSLVQRRTTDAKNRCGFGDVET